MALKLWKVEIIIKIIMMIVIIIIIMIIIIIIIIIIPIYNLFCLKNYSVKTLFTIPFD